MGRMILFQYNLCLSSISKHEYVHREVCFFSRMSMFEPTCHGSCSLYSAIFHQICTEKVTFWFWPVETQVLPSGIYWYSGNNWLMEIRCFKDVHICSHISHLQCFNVKQENQKKKKIERGREKWIIQEGENQFYSLMSKQTWESSETELQYPPVRNEEYNTYFRERDCLETLISCVEDGKLTMGFQ